MSRFLDDTIVEDYIYDPFGEKFEKFSVSGSTQIRTGTNYMENNFSADVTYREGETGLVDFKIENLKQTNKGLVYEFAKDFYFILTNISVKLNSKYYADSITNYQEIIRNWENKKVSLLEKYKKIPNAEDLLDNFELSLKDEEKIRKTVFGDGIGYAFFPGIKPFVGKELFNKKVRYGILPGYHFGLEIPLKEELTLRRQDGTVTVEVRGHIDVLSIKDQKEFLKIIRRLYDESVSIPDVYYVSEEKYTLSSGLRYRRAELKRHFEIKGVHFKIDTLRYKPNEEL